MKLGQTIWMTLAGSKLLIEGKGLNCVEKEGLTCVEEIQKWKNWLLSILGFDEEVSVGEVMRVLDEFKIFIVGFGGEWGED